MISKLFPNFIIFFKQEREVNLLKVDTFLGKVVETVKSNHFIFPVPKVPRITMGRPRETGDEPRTPYGARAAPHSFSSLLAR